MIIQSQIKKYSTFDTFRSASSKDGTFVEAKYTLKVGSSDNIDVEAIFKLLEWPSGKGSLTT